MLINLGKGWFGGTPGVGIYNTIITDHGGNKYCINLG